MRFQENGDTICAVGSNADIVLSQDLLMKNAEGSISLELPQKPTLVAPQEVRSGLYIISPTTNGVLVRCDIKTAPVSVFFIKTGKPHLNVRTNDRCLAFMKEEYRPLAVLSCVGAQDAYGNIIAPARLEYQKVTDKKYKVTISAMSPVAQSVLFELNLYENKLFHDTTVESFHSAMNNVFGGVGFIGNSTTYGEQWLYTRLDYSHIPEMVDKRVYKVILHIPKLCKNIVELSAFKVTARFCSFGSNWNNRVPDSFLVANSVLMNGYQNLDVTSLLVDQQTGTLSNSEGLILKSRTKGSGFSVITTGDSYFAPQILEINYC